MKRLTVVIVFLFIVICSAWAVEKAKLIKTYSEIPYELRGTWYSLFFSVDKGETSDEEYKPLLTVDRSSITTAYYTDRIVKTEKYDGIDSKAFLFYSEEEGVKYLLIYYQELPDMPILYMYKGEEEQFRSCVKIIKI